MVGWIDGPSLAGSDQHGPTNWLMQPSSAAVFHLDATPLTVLDYSYNITGHGYSDEGIYEVTIEPLDVVGSYTPCFAFAQLLLANGGTARAINLTIERVTVSNFHIHSFLASTGVAQELATDGSEFICFFVFGRRVNAASNPIARLGRTVAERFGIA